MADVDQELLELSDRIRACASRACELTVEVTKIRNRDASLSALARELGTAWREGNELADRLFNAAINTELFDGQPESSLATKALKRFDELERWAIAALGS